MTERFCENCKYFEFSNIHRTEEEKEVIGRHCYKDFGILLDDDVIVCEYWEKEELMMTFEIKEYGSCYELIKNVKNENGMQQQIQMAHIWFDDVFPDSNMLSKSKAYEIITTLKKQLEEESKGFKFCCNHYGCCDKYGQEKVE